MNTKSNPTIEHCINTGMHLEYLNREDYKLKMFSKKVKKFLSKEIFILYLREELMILGLQEARKLLEVSITLLIQYV